MEQLRKIGELCRQHYEKLILVLALLILAIAVFVLYSASQTEAEKVQKETEEVTRKAVQGIPAEDLSRHVVLMSRLTNPPPLNFSGEHNLFSPVRWQTNIFDGKFLRIRSGKDTGPDRLEVVKITPLELIIAFDRVAGNGYYLTETNQTVDPRYRSLYRRSYFLKINETNRTAPVVIREVKGPDESPSALVIEFLETGDRATVETNKPAQRVLAYEADLKYPLEDKTFPGVRVGATIRFAGEDYKVVAITQNEVVITAPNGRQYRRQVNPALGNTSP